MINLFYKQVHHVVSSLAIIPYGWLPLIIVLLVRRGLYTIAKPYNLKKCYFQRSMRSKNEIEKHGKAWVQGYRNFHLFAVDSKTSHYITLYNNIMH